MHYLGSLQCGHRTMDTLPMESSKMMQSFTQTASLNAFDMTPLPVTFNKRRASSYDGQLFFCGRNTLISAYKTRIEFSDNLNCNSKRDNNITASAICMCVCVASPSTVGFTKNLCGCTLRMYSANISLFALFISALTYIICI